MTQHADYLCYILKDKESLQELMSQLCRLSGDSYKKWHEFIEKIKSFGDVQ
jgi:hypothetical protein